MLDWRLFADGVVVLERYLSIDSIEGRGSIFAVTLRFTETPDVADDDPPHVASTG
jgi:hypothetical protein